MHAGATLVRAHALRALGRFDESTRAMDQLDNNFPAMQSIHSAILAQIAFLGGNVNEARQHAAKGIIQARDSGAGEAALIEGWIAMAEKNYSQAKSSASRLRALQPDSIETAILEALSTVYEHPNRARDALQTLRRSNLNSSPHDWHYHEALAIVHAYARDPQFAKREIDKALAVAPLFIRDELLREQGQIAKGQPPTIDWNARLLMQWQPRK